MARGLKTGFGALWCGHAWHALVYNRHQLIQLLIHGCSLKAPWTTGQLDPIAGRNGTSFGNAPWAGHRSKTANAVFSRKAAILFSSDERTNG